MEVQTVQPLPGKEGHFNRFCFDFYASSFSSK
jgi:hypothetical protein